MPTDLQASTSSTSSMCKQNSLEDSSSNGLDKSKDESTLSRELHYTYLTNGSTNSTLCSTPVSLSCILKDDNDRSNYDKCKVICSNPKCDQSGWIHTSCVKMWDQCVRSELSKLSPSVRNCLERKAVASLNSSSSSSSSNNTNFSSSSASSLTNSSGWLETLQTALPGLYKCRCQKGTLMRLEPNTIDTTSTTATNTNSNRRKINAQQPSSLLISNSNQSQQNLTKQTSGFSSTGFNYTNNNSRKNSLEMSPSTSFNNFNKRMRSRTLSANQMVAGGGDGMLNTIPPYDFILSKKESNAPSSNMNKSSGSTTSSTTNKQTSQQQNGIIKGKSINNNNNQQHPYNRQRHHSSCYHGTSSNEYRGVSPPTPNSAGNIFKQRSDFKSFQKLPFSKQNAYFIQMEDDSCTGNDDTKVYLLTLLSQQNRNHVNCLVCNISLPVYDHLPLIDGTFFMSPICHSRQRAIPIPAFIPGPPGTLIGSRDSGQSNQSSNNNNNLDSNNGASNLSSLDKYLHALCVNCMHEIVICCQACHRPWTGAQLLVGSLYTYDVFAAVPCCTSRLTCNKCSQVCVHADKQNGNGTNCNNNNNTVNTDSSSTTSNDTTIQSTQNKSSTPTLMTLLSNFSQLSRSIECVHCHARDFHFVKPFAEIYKPIGYVN